ncbi:MAG: hypothetical protein AAFO82_21925, partial [Bacteroidota bacterium]
MYGYMEGNTNFKNDIYSLMNEIKKNNDSLNINFVNDEVFPIRNDFSAFLEYYNPRKLREMGNINSTDLNDIISTILEKQKINENPSILLSDYTFSLERNSDVTGELARLKGGITAKLLDYKLVDKDYGILILKLVSEFNGKYYDKNNNVVILDKKERPYYLWVIGNRKILKNFGEKYELSSFPGYKDQVLFYNSEKDKTPFYSILTKTEKMGSFVPKNRNKKRYKSIERIKVDRRNDNVFQFAVAVDLSNIPVSEKYITNNSNYTIGSSVGDNVNIDTIIPISGSNIEQQDQRIVSTATHLLLVKYSERPSAGSQDLSITLNKKMPSWIEETSTEVDNTEDIASGKTFGLIYVVKGVSEVFTPTAG